ncbi:MAG: endonuclease III [candidate division Zixibacteria bacterium]|nr:endonuclease III [candidate division Zixibacteria bacterium]
MEDSKQIRTIEKLLEKEYGKKILRLSHDPLSELIATILSQNTSDNNSHRAYRNLKHNFKNWEEVKSAPLSKIVQSIKVGGLEKIKAERIKNILSQIYREKGIESLDFLKKWDTEKVKDYLSHFTGVGDKTIACVLLFALGRPVLPVDTHILRVSKRLGLIPWKTDSKKAHILLQNKIPPALVYPFHLDLIEHGRKICKARIPLCGDCVLFQKCEFKDKHKYI